MGADIIMQQSASVAEMATSHQSDDHIGGKLAAAIDSFFLFKLKSTYALSTILGTIYNYNKLSRYIYAHTHIVFIYVTYIYVCVCVCVNYIYICKLYIYIYM